VFAVLGLARGIFANGAGKGKRNMRGGGGQKKAKKGA
jgi:hypothetical protein